MPNLYGYFKSNILMKTVLWLDDWRDPHTNPEWVKMFSPIPFPDKVYWVKSYAEFVDHLYNVGLPDVICFDHDLGFEDGNEYTPTGYDCAVILMEYLQETGQKMPLFGVQSANPVGKERIINALNNYQNGICSS